MLAEHWAPEPGQFGKACACCGAVYPTLAAYRALPMCGVMDLGGEALELRHCSGDGCRTTLAVAVQRRRGAA